MRTIRNVAKCKVIFHVIWTLDGHRRYTRARVQVLFGLSCSPFSPFLLGGVTKRYVDACTFLNLFKCQIWHPYSEMGRVKGHKTRVGICMCQNARSFFPFSIRSSLCKSFLIRPQRRCYLKQNCWSLLKQERKSI